MEAAVASLSRQRRLVTVIAGHPVAIWVRVIWFSDTSNHRAASADFRGPVRPPQQHQPYALQHHDSSAGGESDMESA